MFGWGCRWIYEMDAAGMMPGRELLWCEVLCSGAKMLLH
jgi:hypothetical protein